MTPEEYKKAIITISKEKLATLPTADYAGEIFLVDNLSKLPDAIQALKNEKIIGFDTETRPSFKRGVLYNVSLIQLATSSSCYLFRTNEIGFPKELMEILENPKIMKVGLSIHDDFHNLRRVTKAEPQGFIDLQNFVKDYKISDNSLSRLYGILFNQRISKGQRLTNWESPDLSKAQQMYAALDAYACIRIYEYLNSGKFKPEESPYLTLPPEADPTNEEESQ